MNPSGCSSTRSAENFPSRALCLLCRCGIVRGKLRFQPEMHRDGAVRQSCKSVRGAPRSLCKSCVPHDTPLSVNQSTAAGMPAGRSARREQAYQVTGARRACSNSTGGIPPGSANPWIQGGNLRFLASVNRKESSSMETNRGSTPRRGRSTFPSGP